ncbi:MAG: toxin-antitoxin system [Micrococcales bacterium]|nr:toxin-antitoxin system [Micrococcales bacterium]
MATLTIRGVDDETRHRIQVRAASNGRSMEAEIRETLSRLYDEVSLGDALLRAAEQFRHDHGGLDLAIPERSAPRVLDLADGHP